MQVKHSTIGLVTSRRTIQIMLHCFSSTHLYIHF